ncbi:MAG: homoserine dehydrogenase [Dehalococcoidia bacterium]
MGREIGVGLLGVGVVGSGVARALGERGGYFARQVGAPIIVRRAAVRDLAKPRGVTLPAGVLANDPWAVISDPNVDIVVEVVGGEEPAGTFVREALERGKHVVTANKELIAKAGAELLTLAQDRRVALMFEASVGGGIPIIGPLQRDLLANQIAVIRAIINGTTNYILTRMAQEGASYHEALAEAQRLGYAEADPANDVAGIDAAYKLAIMASLAFRTRVRPNDVHTEGITSVDPRDFLYADELGYVIKLLAIAERTDSGILSRVGPALLPAAEPLAKVDGVYNAIQIHGDLTGTVTFQGEGAGAGPTSSAVIADLLEVARAIVLGHQQHYLGPEGAIPSLGMDVLETRYYIRLTVADQPGVLAQIARVLGDAHVSIAAVNQKEAYEEDRTAELVIMTHRAREMAVRQAMTEIGGLPVVTEVNAVYRVEGEP